MEAAENPAPDVDAEFARLCRRMGWRATAQRRAVFAWLCGNDSHPDVEAVWRAARRKTPDVSLDTVYRILNELADAGVTRRLAGGRTLRYDGNVEAHHHFQCGTCGRLFDFTCRSARAVLEACRPFGEVSTADLMVFGRCRDCAASAGKGDE